MSLQTRTAAPGKARRAAKGKPRHTAAQKAAKKAAPSTTRYSDRETVSKKEVRLADRSKLRAQRFQERTASKSKNIEGAPKGNPKQSREERTFAKAPRKAPSRAAKFVAERAERAARPERTPRPNFVPQKREKFKPGAPRRADSARTAPVRDRRESFVKTRSNVATDFGADDNYISVNLADANLVEATPRTEVTTTFRELGVTPAPASALSAQGITHPAIVTGKQIGRAHV